MGDEHGQDSSDSMYFRLSMEELVLVSRLAYWKWQLLGFMLDSYGEWSQDVPTMLKSSTEPMVSAGCLMVDGRGRDGLR